MNLPVVEILKLGLSGFCFLLAYLSYDLLKKEQAKEYPRDAILRLIQIFMGFALLLGILVGVLPLFGRGGTEPPFPTPTPVVQTDYVLDYTFHKIDLSGFKPVEQSEIQTPRSIVFDDRVDYLRKTTTADKPFLLPYYTMGLSVECQPLRYSVLPTFSSVINPGEPNKKSYEYSLSIGSNPIGHTEIVMNRFKFTNGFRDPNNEWWIASVKYPTKAVAVLMIFPTNKPCKSINAYRQQGISERGRILDNPPIIANEGKYIYWLGTDEKADSKIQFEWQW